VKQLALLIVLVITACLVCGAQNFDLAVMKTLSPKIRVQSGSIEKSPSILYIRGGTMILILKWAYGLQTYEIEGPNWIQWRETNDMPRYDIIAKFPETSTDQQVRQMLQYLLQERVGLRAHYVMRERSIYAASIGSDGFKVKFSGKNEQSIVPRIVNTEEVEISFKDSTMKQVCLELSKWLQVPLIDNTNLGEKRFSVVMKFRRDQANTQDLDSIHNSILSGLKKDLGLNVSKSKSPVKVLVVDSINQNPTAN